MVHTATTSNRGTRTAPRVSLIVPKPGELTTPPRSVAKGSGQAPAAGGMRQPNLVEQGIPKEVKRKDGGNKRGRSDVATSVADGRSTHGDDGDDTDDCDPTFPSGADASSTPSPPSWEWLPSLDGSPISLAAPHLFD